jgi:hypothetical protein
MLQLSLALDALHEPLAFWVHYNDPQAKRELLERYEALPARQQAALEQAVERVFPGPTLTVYRRTKPGDPPGKGGMSVSTDRPTYMTAFETFELRPEDVLLHWAVTYPNGDTTALGSKGFGHEHEVILRPGARPRRLNGGRVAESIPKSSYFRGGHRAIEALSNPEDLPGAGARDTMWIEIALTNAIEAGATPPLEYMGAGAEGVVFCDAHFAYKVSRRKKALLSDEAEWLSVASQIPEVRPYVAAFERWDPEHGVIVRECIRGRHGAWNAGKKVRELWDHVAPYMLAEGWTMPEFKEDSVVFDEDGRPKLVDAGFVSRVSNRLLAYIEDILDGKIERRELDDDSTLAFYIRREFGQKEPLNEERAHRLLARLYALGARE